MAPKIIDDPSGVTAMDFNIAAVTERVVFPETVPNVALITELPVATPVARPVLLSIVATDGVPEFQVTCCVMM
jgi:hypothetical protein